MTASTTSSTLGSMSSSRGRAEGMIPSRAARALHGRAQVAPRRPCTRAAISAPKPAGERPLLGRHERAGARDRLEHRVELHRHELRERDDLAEDLVLEDELGDGVEHDREHPAVRHDRRGALGEVGAREGQRRVGIADSRARRARRRDRPRAGGSSSVQELVLDEEHRPLVLDGRRRGARRRRGTRCRDDADVRDPEEELLERLAVRRPVPATRPIGARTTSGTVTWSSYISRNFEMPFTIWSSPARRSRRT